MLKIVLKQPNQPPQVAHADLKNERAAKIALESIREAWALDGHMMHYDGKTLQVGDVAQYTIEPA